MRPARCPNRHTTTAPQPMQTRTCTWLSSIPPSSTFSTQKLLEDSREKFSCHPCGVASLPNPRLWWQPLPQPAGVDVGVFLRNILVVVVHRIPRAVVTARKARPIMIHQRVLHVIRDDVSQKAPQVHRLRGKHIVDERADVVPVDAKVEPHELKHAPRCRLPRILVS